MALSNGPACGVEEDDDEDEEDDEEADEEDEEDEEDAEALPCTGRKVEVELDEVRLEAPAAEELFVLLLTTTGGPADGTAEDRPRLKASEGEEEIEVAGTGTGLDVDAARDGRVPR